MKKNSFIHLPLVLAGLSLSFFTNCTDENSATEKAVEEYQTEGKISSIIRSPISAEGMQDTVNVARMTFENTVFDFGEVGEGEIVQHVFKFTNTGKVPLVINNAQSTCGCTVPQWPQSPIQPGGQGEIKVEFNTKSKPDFQEKPVTISANTFPSRTTVYLKGYVNPQSAN